MRAEEVVRYARLFSELINGSVDVQSKARRSYKAGVIPTEALLALGMLKLFSLMIAERCYKGYLTLTKTKMRWKSTVDGEIARLGMG